MLTNAQLEELLAFADDDRKPVSLEAVEALYNLHTTVQKNLLRHLAGERKRNVLLREKLERQKERTQEKIEAGEFVETGLDSIKVAIALLYQLQQLRTYKLNKYKIQEILYEMYASWLESKNERLFIEHPVATEYGPRFWRVFKKVETSVPVPYDIWAGFAEQNPGIAKFCKNAANKYYDYAEGTLNRMFMASKPYKNADKNNNAGKWNKEISDAEIYAWKKATKN